MFGHYMFNRGNGYDYSDPSGLYPGQVGDASSGNNQVSSGRPFVSYIYVFGANESRWGLSGAGPAMTNGQNKYLEREAEAVAEQLNAENEGFKTVEEWQKYRKGAESGGRPSSINQINRQIQRDQEPRGIHRADPPHVPGDKLQIEHRKRGLCRTESNFPDNRDVHRAVQRDDRSGLA